LGKRDGLTVIWPAYFDIDRSRAEGRAVPKSLAVEAPTAEEIFEVCTWLKLSPVLEDKKKMPGSVWTRPGRVLIKKEGTKVQALRGIAASLQRKKSAAQKKASR
jgi:signal recognition particle subunit SRP19